MHQTTNFSYERCCVIYLSICLLVPNFYAYWLSRIIHLKIKLNFHVQFIKIAHVLTLNKINKKQHSLNPLCRLKKIIHFCYIVFTAIIYFF